MRGLSLIGTAGIHVVIRSYRNFQVLFLVPIVVAKEEAEGAVLVLEPSFKRARNALPGIVQRLQRQALSPQMGRACQPEYSAEGYERAALQSHIRLPVGFP